MNAQLSAAPMTDDYDRRFGGTARLYGAEGLARLATAHVCVVGVGGVGAWAVEALARSGVGQLTLIDLDHVAPSNINRQLPALTSTLGMAKVLALQSRCADINPRAQVHGVEEFVSRDNVDSLLAGAFDYVIDAVDDVRAKVALIAHARSRGVPLITVGGAGGKRDASRLTVADLAHTTQDPLAASVRYQLRRQHGFARGGAAFGVPCVYSTEPMQTPATHCAPGLQCGGYGSAVVVTATAGMLAAGYVLNALVAA